MISFVKQFKERQASIREIISGKRADEVDTAIQGVIEAFDGDMYLCKTRDSVVCGDEAVVEDG